MSLTIIPKAVPDLTKGEKKFLEILKLSYKNEVGVYIYILQFNGFKVCMCTSTCEGEY